MRHSGASEHMPGSGVREGVHKGGRGGKHKDARTYSGGNEGARSTTVVLAMGPSSAGLDPALGAALRPRRGHAPSRGTGARK